MKVIIQAVPERLANVKVIQSKVPDAKVYIDHTHEGNLISFKKSLALHEDDYVLRLQDDVMLPLGFSDYLPVIEAQMKANDIHVLNLFCLKRKSITEQFDRGLQYAEYMNFLGLVATVFSPYASKKLIEYAEIDTHKKHDDVFVRNFIHVNKLKSYVHLPNIVQHSLNMVSSVGHPQSKSRQSPYFDKNYIVEFFNAIQND